MEKEGLDSVLQAENILSVFSQTNPQCAYNYILF